MFRRTRDLWSDFVFGFVMDWIKMSEYEYQWFLWFHGGPTLLLCLGCCCLQNYCSSTIKEKIPKYTYIEIIKRQYLVSKY